MNPSDEKLRQLQSIWKAETGQDIDLETAREYALNIIGLVECVYKKHTHRARDSPQ